MPYGRVTLAGISGDFGRGPKPTNCKMTLTPNCVLFRKLNSFYSTLVTIL